jgi:hypothetical protein
MKNCMLSKHWNQSSKDEFSILIWPKRSITKSVSVKKHHMTQLLVMPTSCLKVFEHFLFLLHCFFSFSKSWIAKLFQKTNKQNLWLNLHYIECTLVFILAFFKSKNKKIIIIIYYPFKISNDFQLFVFCVFSFASINDWNLTSFKHL